jgi:hypothetical protein
MVCYLETIDLGV